MKADFRKLSNLPMEVLDLGSPCGSALRLRERLQQGLKAAHPEAVLFIRTTGPLSEAEHRVLSSKSIRGLAPPTMTVRLQLRQ